MIKWEAIRSLDIRVDLVVAIVAYGSEAVVLRIVHFRSVILTLGLVY